MYQVVLITVMATRTVQKYENQHGLLVLLKLILYGNTLNCSLLLMDWHVLYRLLSLPHQTHQAALMISKLPFMTIQDTSLP